MSHSARALPDLAVLVTTLVGCGSRAAPAASPAAQTKPDDRMVLLAPNPGHPSPVEVGRLAVTPDAERIVATAALRTGHPPGPADRGVRIWERRSGRAVAHLGDEVVRGFDVARSGKLVVTAGADGVVRVWDVEQRSLRWSAIVGGDDLIGAWLLDEDGSRVLTLERTGRVVSWHQGVASPKRVKTVAHRVTMAKLAEDRSVLALGNRAGDVQLVVVATFDEIQVGTAPAPVTALAVAPDSRHVVTGHETGHIYSWPTNHSWQKLGENIGRTQYPVGELVVLADGSLCALSSGAGSLWCRRGNDVIVLATQVRTFVTAAEGKLVVAGLQNGSIQTFDRKRGLPQGSELLVDRLGFTAAGDLLACGVPFDQLGVNPAPTPPPCRLWHLTARGKPSSTALLTGIEHQILATSVAGRLVAVQTGMEPHVLHRVYDASVDPPKMIFEVASDSHVSAAAFSQDERWLVLAGRHDGKLDVIEVGRRRRVHRFHAGPQVDDPDLRKAHRWVERVAIANDGALVAMSHRTGIHLWDAPSAGFRGTIQLGPGPVPLLAFSPDDKILVVATQRSGLEVWNPVGPVRMRNLLPGDPMDWTTDVVVSGALAADGVTLATGHLGSLRVWDVLTGTSKVLLQGGAPIASVALRADGKQIAWGDRLGGLYVQPL